MKIVDVVAGVILMFVTGRLVVGVCGGPRVSWRSGTRYATVGTAGVTAAALAGGVVSLRDTGLIVGSVYLFGVAWGWAGERLPGRVPVEVPTAVSLLIGVSLVVQSRLAGELASTTLKAAALATFVVVLAARYWHNTVRVLDHGPVILGAGLVLYSVAVLAAVGKLAAVPVPGLGTVQIGDLARITVLVGSVLVVTDQPWRASAVYSRGSRAPRGLPDLRVLGPLGAAWVVALGAAVLTLDFGGAALLFIELVVVTAATTRRVWPLGLGIPLLVGAGFAAERFIGHVAGRFQIWLHPETLAIGDQHVTAASAWTSGDLFGLGLGGGRPLSIPAGNSDYILAVLGEELGSLGSVTLLVCLGVVVIAAARVVWRSDTRSAAVGLAIGVFISFQTLAVVGGVTGAGPMTGIPLPWLSHGGAALVTNTLAAGLLTIVAATATTCADKRVREADTEIRAQV